MVVNIWSKHNTEQSPALHTGEDLTPSSHSDTVQKLHFLLKCEIKSLKLRKSKVCMNQSLPGLRQTVDLQKNLCCPSNAIPGLVVSVLHILYFSSALEPPPSSPLPSSKEDNKDDEEDDEDQKDLDHQPAVGGDGLEVFEDLHVCSLHVQLGVLHVGVDPGAEPETRFKYFSQFLFTIVDISAYKVK